MGPESVPAPPQGQSFSSVLPLLLFAFQRERVDIKFEGRFIRFSAFQLSCRTSKLIHKVQVAIQDRKTCVSRSGRKVYILSHIRRQRKPRCTTCSSEIGQQISRAARCQIKHGDLRILRTQYLSGMIDNQIGGSRSRPDIVLSLYPISTLHTPILQAWST